MGSWAPSGNEKDWEGEWRVRSSPAGGREDMGEGKERQRSFLELPAPALAATTRIQCTKQASLNHCADRAVLGGRACAHCLIVITRM